MSSLNSFHFSSFVNFFIKLLTVFLWVISHSYNLIKLITFIKVAALLSKTDICFQPQLEHHCRSSAASFSFFFSKKNHRFSACLCLHFVFNDYYSLFARTSVDFHLIFFWCVCLCKLFFFLSQQKRQNHNSHGHKNLVIFVINVRATCVYVCLN